MTPNDSEKHARFMALLEPCLAKLSRYAHAMTKDVEDGRDLLSDAILLAYENFEKLRATEAFTSYIFTTTRRLYYRRERRKKLWGIFPSGAEEIADERGPSAEMRLDLEALDRALLALPEKQREAVVLFEISGLSLAEIREIQGGTLSGVKSRIVRGREKLAELLGEQPRTAVPREPAPRGTSFERAQVATLMRGKL
ncbi:MAG: RNA polymerase sigma factor [Candidatus Kapaibacterium sp.]